MTGVGGVTTHGRALDAPDLMAARGGCLQKTKDHFLEVKMESSRQRLFHFLSDLAYIEVRGWAPPSRLACPWAVAVSTGRVTHRAAGTKVHPLSVLGATGPKSGRWQGSSFGGLAGRGCSRPVPAPGGCGSARRAWTCRNIPPIPARGFPWSPPCGHLTSPWPPL